MIACRDCRHIYYPGDEDEGRAPRCHHPQSFKELPVYLTHNMKTIAQTIEMMRTLGACGWDAKLFEPKER